MERAARELPLLLHRQHVDLMNQTAQGQLRKFLQRLDVFLELYSEDKDCELLRFTKEDAKRNLQPLVPKDCFIESGQSVYLDELEDGALNAQCMEEAGEALDHFFLVGHFLVGAGMKEGAHGVLTYGVSEAVRQLDVRSFPTLTRPSTSARSGATLA